MVKPALLIVDMLNDFVKKGYNQGAYCERANNVVGNIKALTEYAIANNIPLVYCSDAHIHSDYELTRNGGRWDDHAMQGTEGSKIISELPTEGMKTFSRGETLDDKFDVSGFKAFNVEKGTYSGFFETTLDKLLKKLGVNTVYIMGLCTNICDMHTSAGAFFRGYKIKIVRNGVDTFTEEENQKGLSNLEFLYGAKILSLEEAKKELQDSTKVQ